MNNLLEGEIPSKQIDNDQYKTITRQEIAENYLNQPKSQIDHNSIMIIDDVYSNDNIAKP